MIRMYVSIYVCIVYIIDIVLSRIYDISKKEIFIIDIIGIASILITLYIIKNIKLKKIEVSLTSIQGNYKIYSALYGGIIGDMLGVPVEFEERDTFKIKGVTGYGTYNQPEGTWSDDTSLTLCLVENIIEKGNIKTLMEKFIQYEENGYKTPFGKIFDIGLATSNSIWKFKNGVDPNECGGITENDNGNGAIMRISPVTFLLVNEHNFKKRIELIKEYTEITHAHPRAIVGSIIYIELLLGLYNGSSIERTIKRILKLFENNFDESHIFRQELKYYSRIFNKDFRNVRRNEIKSTGYIVDTLEASIWCLLTTRNFKEAVLKAVNLGDDTDTVGTITGSLAGMYYGAGAIPEKWLAKVVKKNEIDDLMYKFSSVIKA